jgi:hypothetical protein
LRAFRTEVEYSKDGNLRVTRLKKGILLPEKRMKYSFKKPLFSNFDERRYSSLTVVR